jgi:mRNA-degrading endonuclease RelE of RelBE toxin-antitoxin system
MLAVALVEVNRLRRGTLGTKSRQPTGAQRHVEHAAVAWAVIEFITGLAENRHRVGAELRGHLKGVYSAHMGSFRVQHEIDDENRTVTVRRVEHRSDIYGLP